MDESLDLEEKLFSQAFALAPGERPAFLARACGDDAALRRRIEGLLRATERAGAFLDSPSTLGPEIVAGRQDTTDLSGARIGPYRLIEKIGEGGAGVVYEAEQEEPVRRRVALKLLKPGMDTAAAIARFAAERQAIALMEHPNIARVFDAGATEQGRLYFAMELVRGVRITDYCEQSRLPVAARLDLFIAVCHAVQHAHQKGIIHRDLKPTNILVTLHDGVPVPKVIDFGIAKAVEGRLADRTALTEFEQVIGTPAYMSPEQANAGDLDTRSDIYSLGVVLYELLTGRPPFDPQELLRAGLNAARSVINERGRRARLDRRAARRGVTATRACSPGRSGLDRAQGAREGPAAPLPDRQRAGRRRRAPSPRRTGARPPAQRGLPGDQIHPSAPDRRVGRGPGGRGAADRPGPGRRRISPGGNGPPRRRRRPRGSRRSHRVLHQDAFLCRSLDGRPGCLGEVRSGSGGFDPGRGLQGPAGGRAAHPRHDR
jgi:tRNA A-37 threonylcarbamoyl transferase component Bud32